VDRRNVAVWQRLVDEGHGINCSRAVFFCRIADWDRLWGQMAVEVIRWVVAFRAVAEGGLFSFVV